MKNAISIHYSLFAIYLCVLLVSGCSLDSYMFNSSPLDHYTVSNAIIPDSLRTAVQFESEGNTLYGFYCKQPDTMRIEPHPVIIYHHGNRDNIEFYWARVELLWQCGFDVFVYDYRGFGMSEGTSTNATLETDSRAAYNYLLTIPGIDTAQIVDYGFSLGGVPALYSASEVHRARCIVLEASYATGEDLVQSGTLLDIPGEYLLEGDFDNVVRIPNINTPVLFIHGTDDRLIDINRHGKKLYDAANNPKTFVEVKGADHDNIPETMGIESYIELVRVFVRSSR